MATTEPYFSLVKTGASSWSAVLIQSDASAAQASPDPTRTIPRSRNVNARAGQFPRLALALVALTIFAASVTAEIEYLRQTGHLFR